MIKMKLLVVFFVLVSATPLFLVHGQNRTDSLSKNELQGIVQDPKTPEAIEAEFEKASRAMRDKVGELSVLQAEYQKPGSDKASIAKKFETIQVSARVVGKELEEAALALLTVKPEDARAREIALAIAAGALDTDHFTRTLEIADALEKVGAASPDLLLMAATAAIRLSKLEEASEWLTKAMSAEASPEKVGELADQIKADKTKVDEEMARRKKDAETDTLPRVKIITSKGEIVVELFEDDAPNTVANFVSLVEKGFYNGTPFHRVIGGFMAQGGDPTGTGTGGPGYAIECECNDPNTRKHFHGTLSMAHAGPNTGGSQFFLTFGATEHLDGKHTVFGRVIEGADVLANLERTQGNRQSGGSLDKILKAEIVRKRDHVYDPKKLPDPRG